MKLMAGIILAVAVSVHTVVAWDFSMAVAPMWHSTIFGPYFVAGAIFSGIAALILAMAVIRKTMRLEKYLTPPSSNGDSPEWKSWTPPSDDLKARADFIGRETVPVLSALLGEIEIVLKIARGMIPLLPGGKGGRLPLTHRGHMIANLAQCWRSLGRRPTSGPNSSFTAFSEAVFEAIGWPTDGVQAAVPDALMLLRYHPEKIIR